MKYTGTYRGVPYEVTAHLNYRWQYEVVVWINPEGNGIAEGVPSGHKTVILSCNKWDQWKQQLERHQLPEQSL